MPPSTGNVGSVQAALRAPGGPSPESSNPSLPGSALELVAKLLDVRSLDELDQLEEAAEAQGMLSPLVLKAFRAARRMVREIRFAQVAHAPIQVVTPEPQVDAKPPPPPPSPDDSLTCKQVAQLLGVSHYFVYRRAELGIMPCRRYGKLVRFRRGDVLEWAASERAKEVTPGPRPSRRRKDTKAGEVA